MSAAGVRNGEATKRAALRTARRPRIDSIDCRSWTVCKSQAISCDLDTWRKIAPGPLAWGRWTVTPGVGMWPCAAFPRLGCLGRATSTPRPDLKSARKGARLRLDAGRALPTIHLAKVGLSPGLSHPARRALWRWLRLGVSRHGPRLRQRRRATPLQRDTPRGELPARLNRVRISRKPGGTFISIFSKPLHDGPSVLASAAWAFRWARSGRAAGTGGGGARCWLFASRRRRAGGGGGRLKSGGWQGRELNAVPRDFISTAATASCCASARFCRRIPRRRGANKLTQ